MNVHLIGHSYFVDLVWKANSLDLTEAQLLEIQGTVTGRADSGKSVKHLAADLAATPVDIDVCVIQLGICDLYNEELTPEQTAFVLAECLHRQFPNRPKHYVVCLPLPVFKIKRSIKSVRHIRKKIEQYKEMLEELTTDLPYVTLHNHNICKRWSKSGLHVQTAAGWCSYVNSLKVAIQSGYEKIPH